MDADRSTAGGGPGAPAVALGPDALISIRAAAERFGLATSALRHYDALGLVVPRQRRHGQRMYGRSELRRLALVVLARRLGFPLDTVATILDGDPEARRRAAAEQGAALRAVVDRARSAIALLSTVEACAHPTEAVGCPELVGALDALVDGMDVDELAGRHGAPQPPTRPSSPAGG